jgi:predicted aspartyl protease
MAQSQPVVSTRYPYLTMRVAIRGWQDEDDALIDTGFTGNLVVPDRLLSDELGLPEKGDRFIF